MRLVENRTKLMLYLVQSIMQKNNQWTTCEKDSPKDKIDGDAQNNLLQDKQLLEGEALLEATNRKILIFCKNIDYITMFKERLE